MGSFPKLTEIGSLDPDSGEENQIATAISFSRLLFNQNTAECLFSHISGATHQFIT